MFPNAHFEARQTTYDFRKRKQGITAAPELGLHGTLEKKRKDRQDRTGQDRTGNEAPL